MQIPDTVQETYRALEVAKGAADTPESRLHVEALEAKLEVFGLGEEFRAKDRETRRYSPANRKRDEQFQRELQALKDEREEIRHRLSEANARVSGLAASFHEARHHRLLEEAAEEQEIADEITEAISGQVAQRDEHERQVRHLRGSAQTALEASKRARKAANGAMVKR